MSVILALDGRTVRLMSKPELYYLQHINCVKSLVAHLNQIRIALAYNVRCSFYQFRAIEMAIFALSDFFESQHQRYTPAKKTRLRAHFEYFSLFVETFWDATCHSQERSNVVCARCTCKNCLASANQTQSVSYAWMERCALRSTNIYSTVLHRTLIECALHCRGSRVSPNK